MKGFLPTAACAATLLSVTFATPAQAVITICDVVDQGAGDEDPAVGRIRTACILQGTGFFDGTAEESQGENFDIIRVRGTLEGNGTLVATNAYNLGAWTGAGGELAFATGEFQTDALVGGEFINVTATASTFSNNSAFAAPPLAPNAAFSDSDVRFGNFGGPGVLTATINWDAGIGVLDLGNTGEFAISVPEPASWALMILGFGVAGGLMRRRRTVLA